MTDIKDRVLTYHNFISQCKNEPLWKKLRLEDKLYSIRAFKAVFKNCSDSDLKIFEDDPVLLFSHIGKRGVNRFKRLNEYVDSLNVTDLSSDDKISEFKAEIRRKLNMSG